MGANVRLPHEEALVDQVFPPNPLDVANSACPSSGWMLSLIPKSLAALSGQPALQIDHFVEPCVQQEQGRSDGSSLVRAWKRKTLRPLTSGSDMGPAPPPHSMSPICRGQSPACLDCSGNPVWKGVDVPESILSRPRHMAGVMDLKESGVLLPKYQPRSKVRRLDLPLPVPLFQSKARRIVKRVSDLMVHEACRNPTAELSGHVSCARKLKSTLPAAAEHVAMPPAARVKLQPGVSNVSVQPLPQGQGCGEYGKK